MPSVTHTEGALDRRHDQSLIYFSLLFDRIFGDQEIMF